MKSIFIKPLFINPQAYPIIPELYLISKASPFDFGDSTEYSTKLIYNGRLESKILKSGENNILHLDLYTTNGSCVLGEWYISNSINESSVAIEKNKLIIKLIEN